jgi:hypothetical protein
MPKNIKTYRPDMRSNALNGVVLLVLIFLLLTLPHLVAGGVEKHQLQAWSGSGYWV